MKYLLPLFFLSFFNAYLFSQVYINVEETNQVNSAILQIDETNKGVSFPNVFLNDVNSYAPIEELPAEGLIVYNPNLTKNIQPGYYYWKSTPTPHWERIGGVNEKGTIIQLIDTEFLGYSPTGIGTNSPQTFQIQSGVNITKQRCVKWEVNEGGNGHVYCAYTTNTNKSFSTAFNGARSLNGYLVTIVSEKEWDFVKSNVINDGKQLGGANLNNGIWLGYVKLATPGNNTPEYHWITNENWEISWSNDANTQDFFMSGHPIDANLDSTSKCTFIQPNSSSSERLWSSKDCSTGNSMSNLIIEFNQ